MEAFNVAREFLVTMSMFGWSQLGSGFSVAANPDLLSCSYGYASSTGWNKVGSLVAIRSDVSVVSTGKST